MALSDPAIIWLKNRGISLPTAMLFGLDSGIEGMPDIGRTEVIQFPYTKAGVTINTKYRALRDKKFKQTQGGELRFWNLDSVLIDVAEKTVYIFEGEMDTLAAAQCGLPWDTLLSVPNGARESGGADGYQFVLAAVEEGLSAAKRIVLATDGDAPGLALREALVSIFGAARCWFVDWPSGSKDANGFLLRGGPGELLDLLEGELKPWPVDGLYRMSEIPEPQPISVWELGYESWRGKIAFAPGMLSVFTGYPGHGKTLCGMQLWYNICRRYDVKTAIASFETEAKPHQRRSLRQFFWQLPIRALTAEQIMQADNWIEDHFLWIKHPDRRPSFEWLLDLAEVAVIRYGVKAVQIDPWNKLEADRPASVRETDWIRDRLNESLDFAKTFNVHFQILAHPAKSMDISQRNKRPVLEDISGSRMWENITDQGLAVFRPKIFDEGLRRTEAQLFHLKSRYPEIGYPCRLDLDYDLFTGCYNEMQRPQVAEK